MTQLEKKGLIVRNSQMRLEDGMLDIGLVQITEQLGVIAGLVSNETNDSPIPVNNKNRHLKQVLRNPNCSHLKSTDLVKLTAQAEYIRAGLKTPVSHPKIQSQAMSRRPK